MDQTIIITTTCDQREKLEQIATFLVDSHLAACCQIGGPITSIYRWNGKTEQSDEWICSIKTAARQLDRVVSEIKRLHSYDEPEIVATQVIGGSKSYLEWVDEEVI